MKWKHLFALLLGLSVAACSGKSGTLPTAATSPSPTTPAPSGAIVMQGVVSDTAFRNLEGARIEVLNGLSAGLTTTSGAQGGWGFTGVFDDATQFRATKEGYETAVMPLGPFCAACTPNRWVIFSLKTLAPPASVAGSYAMTITVDPACTSFSEQVRTRTYAVTLPSTANRYFSITPTGATFVPGWDQFEVGVSGNYVAFWFETLVEEVSPGNYLLIGMNGGGFVGPEHPATITTRADGGITYCTVDAASGDFNACFRGNTTTAKVALCESSQHTIVLTPR